MKEMPAKRFTMIDLLDYEVQMARDSLLSPEAVRDRDLAMRKLTVKGQKTETLLNWAQSLSESIDHPGAKAQKTFDILAFVAIVSGILMGTGLIQGLLHYDGSQPVNVIALIAIYAFLQIFLLLNYLFKATVYRLFKKLPGGALLMLLREAAERWMQRRAGVMARGVSEQALIRALVQRLGQLHRRLLQNHGWKLFQDFGIACHASSLVTFMAMLFFNDYTFGWRTTLNLQPELLHSIIHSLALPFSWLGDFANPSLELIEKSQFSRFQKDFVIKEGLDFGARSTAAWWPFLALLILTYGLIPRLILWAILQRSIQADLKNLRFDDFRSEALWTRLSEERSAWASEGPMEAARAPVLQSLTQFKSEAPRNALLVRWRDLPISENLLESFLRSVHNLEVKSFYDARGLSADIASIEAALRSMPNPVLIIASDPWELPGEAVDRIRKILRENFPKNLLILFAPFEEIDGEAKINFEKNKTAWQHAVQALRDPYLGLLETRTN